MPDINPPGSVTGTMAPRMTVLVNGNQIAGVISCRVTNNNFYRSDEWEAVIIPDMDPVWTLDKWCPASPPDGAQDNTPPIMVEIRVYDDNTGGTGNSLIVGKCDKKTWNPLAGTLSISGRDRSADLIQAKTSENFKNKTSSQVAQILAARHGLTAQVTNTTTLVERYYQQDHDKLTGDSFSRTTTEWDLLCTLAQFEQFDVYVKGTTLHFEQPQPPSSDAWVLRLDRRGPITANATAVSFTKDDLAKDIIVIVRSWSSKQGTGFQVTAPPGASVSSGKSTEHAFRFPNLTRAQAQRRANALYADLVRHEANVSCEWPFMTGLTARDLLKVQSGSAGFDTTYYIVEVERELSYAGYQEHIRARNQAPVVSGSAA